MAVCKDCKNAYNNNYLKTYVPSINSKTAKRKTAQFWDRSERSCENCKLPYIPIKKWQKTCSYECGYFLQNHRYPTAINNGLCMRCGRSLEHKRNGAIYCSKTCQTMDHTFKHRGGSRTGIARRRLIIERDNATCYMCNKVIPVTEIELDHLIPYSRGGDSSPQNLSVSCLSCNRSRGNRIGIEQLHRIRELKESNDY